MNSVLFLGVNVKSLSLILTKSSPYELRWGLNNSIQQNQNRTGSVKFILRVTAVTKYYSFPFSILLLGSVTGKVNDSWNCWWNWTETRRCWHCWSNVKFLYSNFIKECFSITIGLVWPTFIHFSFDDLPNPTRRPIGPSRWLSVNHLRTTYLSEFLPIRWSCKWVARPVWLGK